jgi:carbon monoxide dehydrogenase subunit G
MARVVRDVRIQRQPDDVWAVVGDYESIPTWLPVITEAKVQGNERVCQMGDQGTLREEILSRDDAARRYEYRIHESPLPITSYRASMEVQPDGDGSRFIWTIDIEPPEMVEALTPIWDQGVEGLRALLER